MRRPNTPGDDNAPTAQGREATQKKATTKKSTNKAKPATKTTKKTTRAHLHALASCGRAFRSNAGAGLTRPPGRLCSGTVAPRGPPKNMKNL